MSLAARRILLSQVTTAALARPFTPRSSRAMTTAIFKHIDTSALAPGTKPWSKVDADASSWRTLDHERRVTNLREASSASKDDDASVFNTNTSGFALYHEPAARQAYPAGDDDDAAIRTAYYASIEDLLRRRLSSLPSAPAAPSSSSSAKLPQKVKKVVIFDHTIRRRTATAARSPVQQVHVDQTPGAAAARVRRHVEDEAEAEELLKGRYQIVNVWRPLGDDGTTPVLDHPLAVVDWRSTRPDDFVPVDLLYPVSQKKEQQQQNGGTTNGDSSTSSHSSSSSSSKNNKVGPAAGNEKEVRPDESAWFSTEGYEVRGETLSVRPNPDHRFYYVKGMTPDEVLLLKCYDSFGDGEREPLTTTTTTTTTTSKIAVRTPHTAFVDPQTPADAPPRQSIEVRCLVFYE